MECLYNEFGRFYITPNGNYPSVTTILSNSDKSSLDEWIKRVGEKQAEKIKNEAGERGSSIHDLMEDYLLRGKEYSKKDLGPFIWCMYIPLLSWVKRHIQEVIMCEEALYSDILRVAGRVDLVAVVDGKPTIVDFKTSIQMKQREWIGNYEMQCSAYSFMVKERHNISTFDYIIAMTCEDGELGIFEGKTLDHIRDFKKLNDMVQSKIIAPNQL